METARKGRNIETSESESNMRILLRNVNTRLYLNSGDGMDHVGQVCEFKSGGEAIAFAVEHHLSEVEIMYAFPDPHYNFCTGMMGFNPKTALSPARSRIQSG